MTQKAIAKECAEWIRKKVKFRSNISGDSMSGFITVDSTNDSNAYMPIVGFTTTIHNLRASKIVPFIMMM